MADDTNVKGLLGLDFNRDAVLDSAAGNDPLAAQRAQGARWGRALGSVLGGGVQAALGKGEGAGFFDRFGSNVQKGQRRTEDEIIAKQMNITPAQLENRYKVRDAIEQYQPKAADPLDAQIETLTHAMNAASDPEIKQRIANQISVLRKQAHELAKLDRDAAAEEFELEVEEAGETKNITVDGKVVAAQIDPVTGDAYTEDGVVPKGKYALGDITKDKYKSRTTGQRLNDVMPSNEQKGMRELVTSTRESVRMYGKVLANIRDSVTNDGGVSWLGREAQATYTFVDQWTRQISNVARVAGINNPFEDKATPAKYRGVGGQVRFMKDKVTEAKEGKWDNMIPLPEGWDKNASAAQRYRSNIIQLAYMEARQREPSNRGLSDNDIQNALAALGADSANPAVILRNFTEKVTNQARKFNDTLETLPSLDGMTRDQVADHIMGTGWRSLQQELDAFRKDFDFSTDAYGRTVYGPTAQPGGADVGPGEPTNPGAAGAGAGQEIDPEILELLK